jgi:hypothetical protein
MMTPPLSICASPAFVRQVDFWVAPLLLITPSVTLGSSDLDGSFWMAIRAATLAATRSARR